MAKKNSTESGREVSKQQPVDSATHQTATETTGYLTTNQGMRIADNQNSLKAGASGPTLLEDFILREKIFHFDHERIPERIVHARGSGAHGFFEVYESLSDITQAALSNPQLENTCLRSVLYGGRRCGICGYPTRCARLCSS